MRLIVITPEKTVLDENIQSVRFPLSDGSIGILPGRLPLLGKLGKGKLEFNQSCFMIDGGFAQVKGEEIILLTSRISHDDNV